jgi:hypothetical protein
MRCSRTRRFAAVRTSGDWAPNSVGGLMLWLKADAIVGLNDGDDVTTWADSSGNGYDAAQATASKKPHYKVNIINGLPVVRFTRADSQVLVGSGFPAIGNNPFTTAYVFRAAASAALMVGINIGVNAPAESAQFYRNTNLRWTFASHGSGGLATSAPDTNNDTFYYVVATKAAGNGVYTPTINGAATTAATGAADTTSLAATYQIGTNDVSSNYWDGDFAEVIIYNSVLSAGNLTQLNAYLADKYAL